MKLSIGEKFFRFASGSNNRNDGRRRDDICDAYRRRARRSKTISEMLPKINAETAKTRSALCRRHWEIREPRKLESAVEERVSYADIIELIRI